MIAAKELCKEALKGTEEIVEHPEDEAMRIFQKWDVDGSGAISTEELAKVFTQMGLFPGGLSAEDCQQQVRNLLDDIDLDRNNLICYNELIAFLFQGPYLKEYEMYSTQILVEQMKARFSVGKDGLNELVEKQHQQMVKELTPLIKRSFRFHDKNNSGKLEKGESIVFFSNFVSMIPKMAVDIIVKLDQSHAMEVYRKWGEEFKDKQTLMKRFKAAFSLLDSSKDGMLQEVEVIAAMLHGSAENIALMKALESPDFEAPKEVMELTCKGLQEGGHEWNAKKDVACTDC